MIIAASSTIDGTGSPAARDHQGEFTPSKEMNR